MKLVFSSIKNKGIFEDDFSHLSESNGTIEFKKNNNAQGGIAVAYAPNGTGKSSFSSLLEIAEASATMSFEAIDENGRTITPATKAFHIVKDQLNRNVIQGKETDYLVGRQIRRE